MGLKINFIKLEGEKNRDFIQIEWTIHKIFPLFTLTPIKNAHYRCGFSRSLLSFGVEDK